LFVIIIVIRIPKPAVGSFYQAEKADKNIPTTTGGGQRQMAVFFL
jgi:hypothetical protein